MAHVAEIANDHVLKTCFGHVLLPCSDGTYSRPNAMY
jgi:hypothetical protein